MMHYFELRLYRGHRQHQSPGESVEDAVVRMGREKAQVTVRLKGTDFDRATAKEAVGALRLFGITASGYTAQTVGTRSPYRMYVVEVEAESDGSDPLDLEVRTLASMLGKANV